MTLRARSVAVFARTAAETTGNLDPKVIMFSLPSPLHPAIVHFPIVLIVLGAAVAVTAAFLRRWHLPAIAAALFTLGAIGSLVAAQTGEQDDKRIEKSSAVRRILHEHEEWAERTEAVTVVVALLALAAAATGRWPIATRTLGAVTAAGALAAAWSVYQTGHYGGQLVYRHGAGVTAAVTGIHGATAGKNPAGTIHPERPRHHRD